MNEDDTLDTVQKLLLAFIIITIGYSFTLLMGTMILSTEDMESYMRWTMAPVTIAALGIFLYRVFFLD